MPIEINATHDPARTSWVESANAPETDFPIQNLPFGLFRHGGAVRGGVALGEHIIDVPRLHAAALLDGDAAEAARAMEGPSLAPLLGASPASVSALRARFSDLFRAGGPGDQGQLQAMLVPQADAELLMPLKPTAFTDFCTSYDHIARMGQRTPPLAALSLPVAYNGRASSVRASGTPVARPSGQFETPPGSGTVKFAPEPMLDFELEFGVWLRGGNPLGQPVSVAQAEALMFGCCLVNDWSARGIQFFESILGPHLGKSFLTTISPWIVTMEALAPFRIEARERTAEEPAVPAYLMDAEDRKRGGINIELTADLANSAGSSQRIVRSNLAELFWTLAQMVAHQASNGAPLEAGDLIATGTVSGAAQDARACLAEIVLRGGETISLPDGSTRSWLEDGDTLSLSGRAVADGYVSIGFGPCSGTIHPTGASA
ncbi:MAG: fumarylacetoacetate hydrolase family protein [Alphaproteobacteria bacterium]|nr:fumarylacetoacetate hydrolase family protein [Alphaproteobacteria bacterium]MBU0794230.1 fumarylacetoacetate hydrolase family protein [Alphaproteobacteria bacterium]MBU0876581.1 fumarylacetoacetate hydrolase family protein [Alphaproteobacteria bacterium]MBU1769282.1 fumarylacetoacetate hydrolase family protein [Alphaproteobacteria bacterium]